MRRFRLATAASLLLACTAYAAAAAIAPGLGTPITGAGNGTEVVTIDAQSGTAMADLASALCRSIDHSGMCTDNTARVVLVQGVIDFTQADGGAVTAPGCVYADNSCSRNGKQERILDVMGYCAGKPRIAVTYQAAGKTPLLVGANKTLLGIGTHSGLKGKGLMIKSGADNVIVRNLHITDINEGIIWAGDAIQIDRVRNVWLDHNYFARIGRQFVAVGTGAVSNLQISNNQFDGTSDYGHYCDGRHYWNLLFDGPNQSAMIVNNWFYRTSGRSPQVETSQPSESGGMIYLANNFYSDNAHIGIATHNKVWTVMEGNYFALTPAGNHFSPVSVSHAGADLLLAAGVGQPTEAQAWCKKLLGRPCVPNQTGSFSEKMADPIAALHAQDAVPAPPDFASPAVLALPQPSDPATIPTRVPDQAGPRETCTALGC